MQDYIPPDPAVAEFVHAREKELEAARRALQGLEQSELRRRLYSPSEPTAMRILSLSMLLRGVKRDATRKAELADLLEPLLDDADPDILCQAIGLCPVRSEEIIAKLRALTHSTNLRVRSEAIVALARQRDPETFVLCTASFQGSDQSERHLAIGAFQIFDTDESRKLLVEGLENDYRGEEDRLALAIALLGLGDERGLPLLREVAERASDTWSVAAATWIYAYRRIEGLHLMRHILNSGMADAKRMMVLQIAGLAEVVHAYTADGIHEARLWVDRQLESMPEG